MNFTITYAAGTSSAPTGFTAAFNSVAQHLSAKFTDNITINVTVGYGELDGDPLPAGTIGASESFLFVGSTYAAVRNALIADANRPTI